MSRREFTVAQISASKTGAVSFHAIAANLLQGSALQLGLETCRRAGAIVVVASPSLRRVDVLLPDSVHALGLEQTSVLNRRLAQWVQALHAHGEICLSRLIVGGEDQSVSPWWVSDPIVLASLGVVLSPAPQVHSDSWPSPQAFLESVPSTSVAGLLRESLHAARFSDFMERVPVTGWHLLACPLVSTEGSDSGVFHFGWWLRRNSRHAFLCGEACQLAVDLSGDVHLRLMPVRVEGGWQLNDPRVMPRVDPAWQQNGDMRLDQVLHHLPRLADALLLELSAAGIGPGDGSSHESEMLVPMRRLLEQRIRELSATATQTFLEAARLVGVPRPRLMHAHYLAVGGNPERANRRRQAIKIWPALAADLVDTKLPSACDATDAGKPLIPALAHDLGVPLWAVQRSLTLLRKSTTADTKFSALVRLTVSAGASAPQLEPTDLLMLNSWLREAPQHLDSLSSIALIRALGREAAQSGWGAVARLLDHPDFDHDCVTLMAWWDDVRHNVRDTLSRASGQDALPEDVENNFAEWTSDLSMSSSLALARRWSNLLWGSYEGDAIHEDDFEVPALFGALSLLHSRVEAFPLNSATLLRDEGRRMQHCVGSHWRAVVSGQRIVFSLRSPVSGERATAAWAYSEKDDWVRSEALCERNGPILPAGQIVLALDEIERLLAEKELLQPEALAFHKQAALFVPPRAAEHHVNGVILVSALPAALARAAMRCLPGAGTMEKRVLHAQERVWRKQGTINSGATGFG